jgi:hypothetical protein
MRFESLTLLISCLKPLDNCCLHQLHDRLGISFQLFVVSQNTNYHTIDTIVESLCSPFRQLVGLPKTLVQALTIVLFVNYLLWDVSPT